jgi:hypothetical protein
MQFLMIACVLALGQVSALALSPKAALLKMELKTREHPIAKVIAMLEDLKVKAREEGEAEAVSYQKFEYWCKNSLKELNTAIEKEKSLIETLEDEIEAKTKLIAKLEIEIKDLAKQLADSEAAGVKAKEIRDEENKAYTEADKDFDSTISAIKECITALEDAKPSLLAQKSVVKVINLAKYLVSDQERDVLTSFLQQPEKPEAKVYSFKSQNVIELLKKLQEKFETDKLDTTKAETNAFNAYNLAKEAREQAEEAAKKSKEEKEGIKATAEEDLAGYEEDLASTKDDLKANEGALESTTETCSIRAEEWAQRQETRANEIKAMDMAIKILAKVGGVRAPKEGEALIQTKALSFIQINDPKAKAIKILVAEAQKLHSKSLRKLVDQIRKHGAGPFDEIIQMIQKMIFRLMAEQKDEDDHKNWCDMELEKSTESKEDKEEKLKALNDKIDDAEAKTIKLADEIKDLTDAVQELTTYIKEETELRNEAKAENEATIKDAKEAQEAISNAIAVLSDFYKSSGMTLIQKGHKAPVELPESPSTWDSSYTGVSDPTAQPDGIVTVLEEIMKNFAEMESQTAAQEATDQKEYDADMTEKATDKASKETEAEMKGHERKRLLDKLESWKGQKKHVVSELEAVVQYLKDLEPACVSGDSTYEDRKQARTDEIEALREAQTILEEAFKEKPAEASEFLQRKV